MKAILTLSTNPKLPIEIGYEDLGSIVSSLPDTEDMAAVYAEFAKHPSVSVRENVAYKDNLDEKTVKLLAGDKDIAVVRNVVNSEAGRKHLETKLLLSSCARDVDVAGTVAGNVENYAAADADELAGILIKHEDPKVRNCLAGNGGTPKKYLKTLQKDDDARVRETARATLSY